MKNLLSMLRVAAVALFAFALPSLAAAQTVLQLPQFAPPGAVLNVGNGPVEFKMLSGSMAIFTSQGSAVGSTSGSSTALTLTAVPTTPPCIGCAITATNITLGTTVTAYNGVTSITLSQLNNVSASSVIAYGAACPTGQPTNPLTFVQAGVGGDIPFYTTARVCAYGATGPGGQFVTFPIGAH